MIWYAYYANYNYKYNYNYNDNYNYKNNYKYNYKNRYNLHGFCGIYPRQFPYFFQKMNNSVENM